MIPVPSPVESVTIEHDASRSRWRLGAGGASMTLRPWTWGERRRLLAATTITGTLDRSRFARGLFDLLLDPGVPDVEPASLTVACLYLLGVAENGQVLPLARSEFLAATSLGWSPQQIDSQPADDIDRLIAQIQPTADHAGDDGWTRIVIAPDHASSIDQRLESMLMTLARLAGLADTADRAAASPVAPHAAAISLPPPPKNQPSREEPIHSTLGGVARLKRRTEARDAKRSAAGSPAGPPAEDAAGTPLRPPIPEPRIARVSSRVRAGSNDSVLARTARPPDVLTPVAPAPHAPVFTAEGAAAPTHPSATAAALRVSRRASPTPLPSLSSPRSAPDANLRGAHAPVVHAKAAPSAIAHAPAAAGSAVARALEPLDNFPAFRATVRWPEAATPVGPGSDGLFRHDSLPDAPFRLSELEEQIADILDRAAREAGIDLP